MGKAIKFTEIDKDRIVMLYAKFGVMNDVAISMSCSPAKIKNVLVERGIKIKQHRHKTWNKDPFMIDKSFADKALLSRLTRWKN